MSSRRRTWFLIRLAFYVAVIAVLFLVKGVPDWQAFRRLASGKATSDSLLTVAGRDLAPRLVDSLVVQYRADYPQVTVTLTAGGTNQALEDLVNRRADVAFLYRPPTAAEQAQLRTVDGDTAVVVRVAVGGVALVGAAGADTAALDLDAVRELLRTGRAAGCARLYAPDPNDGLWDAARLRCDLPDRTGGDVVFLADETAVASAVASDPDACGLVSTFTIDVAEDDQLVARPVRAESGDPAARPTYTNLVTGAYPLHHWLYVACRGRGGIEGAKFVNHLASARGQRQVRRAGAVPAQQTAREIVITRDPPGS
ncbi:MAG TPA: substrate-binding domain-containing protein [Candidatus Krumholzibacteria bacterium]|nr:substrate-binding domain-containing protein [Candidatus Krumholzibacteria bacterium]HPD70560.1 substrate-binding domain-containing protein [Candidatus Krumholzibacteria bacterium]HRY39740.1 substrate-binding domain-containing protein [Candidatus Krumholzibacteria bacterium]